MQADKNIKRVVGEQSRKKVSAGLTMKSSAQTNVRFCKTTPRRNFSVSANKLVQPIGIQQVVQHKEAPSADFQVSITPVKF